MLRPQPGRKKRLCSWRGEGRRLGTGPSIKVKHNTRVPSELGLLLRSTNLSIRLGLTRGQESTHRPVRFNYLSRNGTNSIFCSLSILWQAITAQCFFLLPYNLHGGTFFRKLSDLSFQMPYVRHAEIYSQT